MKTSQIWVLRTFEKYILPLKDSFVFLIRVLLIKMIQVERSIRIVHCLQMFKEKNLPNFISSFFNGPLQHFWRWSTLVLQLPAVVNISGHTATCCLHKQNMNMYKWISNQNTKIDCSVEEEFRGLADWEREAALELASWAGSGWGGCFVDWNVALLFLKNINTLHLYPDSSRVSDHSAPSGTFTNINDAKSVLINDYGDPFNNQILDNVSDQMLFMVPHQNFAFFDFSADAELYFLCQEGGQPSQISQSITINQLLS